MSESKSSSSAADHATAAPSRAPGGYAQRPQLGRHVSAPGTRPGLRGLQPSAYPSLPASRPFYRQAGLSVRAYACAVRAERLSSLGPASPRRLQPPSRSSRDPARARARARACGCVQGGAAAGSIDAFAGPTYRGIPLGAVQAQQQTNAQGPLRSAARPPVYRSLSASGAAGAVAAPYSAAPVYRSLGVQHMPPMRHHLAPEHDYGGALTPHQPMHDLFPTTCGSEPPATAAAGVI